MSGHTPGPWAWQGDSYKELVSLSNPKICPNGAAQYPVVIDDGSAAGEYTPMIDVNGPDARLIAAAPDLLEAAQKVLSNKRGEDDWLILAVHCQELAAAIAKATGEQA